MRSRWSIRAAAISAAAASPRCVSPMAATCSSISAKRRRRPRTDMYLDAKGEVIKDLSLKGYQAAAVPGSVVGLDALLARYGTLPRRSVMAPAIRLAQEGFVLSQGDATYSRAPPRTSPNQPNVAAIFLNDGKPLEGGRTLRPERPRATPRYRGGRARTPSTRAPSPKALARRAPPMAASSRRRICRLHGTEARRCAATIAATS